MFILTVYVFSCKQMFHKTYPVFLWFFDGTFITELVKMAPASHQTVYKDVTYSIVIITLIIQHLFITSLIPCSEVRGVLMAKARPHLDLSFHLNTGTASQGPAWGSKAADWLIRARHLCYVTWSQTLADRKPVERSQDQGDVI